MNRKIAPVVKRVKLQDKETDFAYWQNQPYADRITALEEIRQEYHAWKTSGQEDKENVQQGFQRVYRIIKQQ
ncbi:MAG: hypothetical protein JEZ00_21710 [Anaerolineaceae bacterium]|nr:hypothetical protein [Anaerolineaceae bacterium]